MSPLLYLYSSSHSLFPLDLLNPINLFLLFFAAIFVGDKGSLQGKNTPGSALFES